jgi:outer membrane receptor for ferrienterochelin and colicins
VEAGVDNIFGYVDRTPHGLHLGTTTPGRTVYATLTVRFNHGKKLKFTNNKSNFNSKNNNEED